MTTSLYTKSKAQWVADQLNFILAENPNESYKTIWEIFCYQSGTDEDSQGIEAYVFDNWVNYQKSLVK